MVGKIDPVMVVLGLVQVINGDSPREQGAKYLHSKLRIHMDSATHRGIEIWYKWIYLIRNCSRLRELRMDVVDVRPNKSNPQLINLTIRWSGRRKRDGVRIVSPRVCRLAYLVSHGRIIEIWTKKENYVAIFGGWIRYRLFYRLFLFQALLLFGILKLLGRSYKIDRKHQNLVNNDKELVVGNWQRTARSKWTFIFFHVAFIGYWIFGDVRVAGSLIVWFVMQLGVHAGYHRYFTHCSFRTHEWFEAVLACVGCLALQNGPLWWAATHRQHHHFADTQADLHSPKQGFWHAHIGWLWSRKADVIDCSLVRDLYRRVPVWVESNQAFIHGAYILTLCSIGGPQALLAFWVTPIVLCWHTTFATNSFCHRFGSQPQSCHPDGFCMARNNLIVGIINLGEGWHNNHHGSPSKCRHGFYRWYELDIVYVILLILEKLRVVWALKR